MLAAALLVAAPLVGSASPAVAADDQKPIDNKKIYTSEADITADLERWAPVEPKESVMGYPKGVQDGKGNTTSVEQRDVQPKYDSKEAVADAKAAAQKYVDDPNTKNDKGYLKDAAMQLVKTSITEPEVRQNTHDDDIWKDGRKNPAPNYCAGKTPGGGTLNTAGVSPCMFVGKLDTAPESKYPKTGGGGALAGGGKKTFKTSHQITDEKSEVAGWSVGGKVAGKITSSPEKGGIGGEAGPEFNFAYSYSSTSTKRNTLQSDDTTEADFPSDVKGSLQGRRDGAYYVGYILAYGHGDPTSSAKDKERLIAIPARVYVQSPKSSTPLTYFKYQEK
ncbi:hypothetical protein ADK86_04680 [Streptomyces sp. NRRL F-5755]|nr:hypothetical protein ADK86_04680 [Streptomyces sp. NRRL F-5755]